MNPPPNCQQRPWEVHLERTALGRAAETALRLCHFAADAGAGASAQCEVACYECLLSYSNQPHHRYIDRMLLSDFLPRLATAETAQEATRDEEGQHQYLLDLVDPRSTLERKFLAFLYDNGLRLPDKAQNRPDSDIPVQPDFYYDREGRPGVCVFVDGPHHDQPRQVEADERLRARLQDNGYRVIAVRHDRPFTEPVEKYPDVFGEPTDP